MATLLPGYHRLAGHKYSTPSGDIITEYRYRTLRARKVGFRNYTEQRRIRESQEFQKYRYDALVADPEAPVYVGGELEQTIASLLKRRRGLKTGGKRGSGYLLERDPADVEFETLRKILGLPEWSKWKFWYSDVATGAMA